MDGEQAHLKLVPSRDVNRLYVFTPLSAANWNCGDRRKHLCLCTPSWAFVSFALRMGLVVLGAALIGGHQCESENDGCAAAHHQRAVFTGLPYKRATLNCGGIRFHAFLGIMLRGCFSIYGAAFNAFHLFTKTSSLPFSYLHTTPQQLFFRSEYTLLQSNLSLRDVSLRNPWACAFIESIIYM